MELKEEYKSLVESVQRHTEKNGKKLSKGQIAEKVGLSRTYFSGLLGGSEELKQFHIDDFKMKFQKELDFPTLSEEKTYKVLLDPTEQATDVVELKAFTKALLHAMAKIQSKVYGMPIDDCLNELVKDTRLNVRDLMEK